MLNNIPIPRKIAHRPLGLPGPQRRNIKIPLRNTADTVYAGGLIIVLFTANQKSSTRSNGDLARGIRQ